MVVVNEGAWAASAGTFSDADDNSTVTLTASVGSITKNDAAGTWSWTYLPTDGPDASQTVTISASDGTDTATATFELAVNNFAPLVQTGGLLTSGAVLVHHYTLNGTLNDQFGGPALAAHGGNLESDRYVFDINQGLQLDHGLTDTSNYSIELVMRYDQLGPVFKKFIDFQQGASDFGLYAMDNTLIFYPGEAGTDTIAAGADFHVVLTRDGASGETKVYLNGVLQMTYFNDVSAAAIPADNVLVFFEDDLVTGPNEAQAGAVDYIAIYDGALSAADVAALAQAGSAAGPDSVTVDEGQTAAISGVYHDPGADTVTVTASVGAISQSSGSHGAWSWSYLADDGPGQSQTVTITATDSDGASSTTTFTLTVNNLAPTAVLSNAGSVCEGSTGTVTFSNQADPSSADLATLHYAYDFDNDGVFDLGDGTYAGSVSAAAATVPAGFLADGPGARTVRARAIDHDDAGNDYTTTITIDNAAPSVAADQATVTVNAGQVAVNTGVFGDPGADTVTLTVSVGALVANGDGTWSWSFPTSNGTPQHQTVTVTATDSDGAQTCVTFNLEVEKVGDNKPGGVTLRDGILYVVGTSAADQVKIDRKGAKTLTVRADFLPGNHTVAFDLAKITNIVATLGDGDDQLNIADCVSLPATVHGGGGNDRLNAGAGPAVLLGDAGNDFLKGGCGRDILMGGQGEDLLVGGAAGDVLVGGATKCDQDDEALCKALAVWTSDASFAARAKQMDALLTVLNDDRGDRIKDCDRQDLILSYAGQHEAPKPSDEKPRNSKPHHHHKLRRNR